MPPSVGLIVNGVERIVPLEPERSLLTVLRDELDLTGAKPGCGEGQCAACTVLIDRHPEHACVYPLAQASDLQITTIEGLVRGRRLHPVQRAFVEMGAMQCGYCIPGMILGTVALLEQHPNPSDADVLAALDGHLCRCCAYVGIRRAVTRAAELMRLGGDGWIEINIGFDRSLPRLRGRVREGASRTPWDLQAPKARDYFAWLGDGLVMVLPPDRGGWWSTGGAWVHVGVNGSVTAFTGKVDVGQDNRTALALLVAEELRVPIGSVRVVMGDTDVCPYDIGTFASRSMADAGASLRATAAAARQWLEGRAATRGHAPIDFAKLLKGRRTVELVGRSPAPTPAARWKTAGQPLVRFEAVDIVTGAQRYPSDMTRPNVLHARVLHPPALGATLQRADVRGATKIPGVTAVHDGSFVGVAASDRPTADRALAAIEAEWARDPQPSEAELDPHLRSHPVEARGWEGSAAEERGQVSHALARAPIRLDATYTSAYLAHAPLEARAVVAEWDRKDHLTVWAGTQVPFGLRESLAEAFDLQQEQVRVIVPLTGGGFGGKHSLDVAIQAARLARASGRPVKLRFTREEEFQWAYFRPAAVIDVHSGATKAGRITAWDFTNINSGRAALDTPYGIANVRIKYQPAAAPLPQGSYRALAATANTFARESHMDELAHRLDQDPLDFRLAHLDDERSAAVLSAVADRVSWAKRPRGSGAGVGIAAGLEKDGRVATAVEVAVERGGQLAVKRIVTAYDCGAIVNPVNLRNQVEGATVMGLGGALFEAVHFEDGRILNAAFSRYRVPRFSDVPPIDVILVDRKDERPAGAGETPMIAVAPALANAIFEATGRRLHSLPLVPTGRIPAD